MSRARWIYAGLERAGALSAWRAMHPGDLVLCYHNVLGAGESPRGDAAVHLPLGEFEAQLDWVMARFEVLPLDALLAAHSAGPRRGRPRAAITFDDAYRGVLTHALPALRRRGLPSTIYITSDASASPQLFWWDLVAEARREEDRTALRNRWKGHGAAIFAALGLSGQEAPLPDVYYPADWPALRAAAGPDLSIGAHTRSHPMLSRLSADELDIELREPRAAIATHLGIAPRTIAYPYGDTSQAVEAAARAAGYDAGFTISGALLRAVDTVFHAPRLNVPTSMPMAAFAAAASGVRLRRETI
jgi:peptidoglycan/xylan/chitin deacetylase (PgdA/CDA1 family)